jgi:endonuclease IV
MPCTTQYLNERMIENYYETCNENIMIHVSYVVKIYNPDTSDTQRSLLRQYKNLAMKLGTKNILIHLPSSKKEFENLEYGIKLIKDELTDKGIIVHFEQPAWTKDLLKYIKSQELETDLNNNVFYFEQCLNHITTLKNWRIVLDTAHMFSNGLETNTMIKLFETYDDKIEYVHLNGNEHPQYSTDSHVPIFAKNNLIKNTKILLQYLAKKNKILICEVTKKNGNWDDWVNLVEEFGFNLVEHNSKLIY